MPSRLDQVSRALFARLSEREDSEIEGLNDAYRSALEQTIERVVGDLPRDADGRLEPDPVALARARREFDRFGDAKGASLLLEQHVERVSAALTRQVDVLSDGWQRLGEDPLESDQLALSTLVKANFLDGFTELGRYHHSALRDAVMRQALGRATERDLRAELQRITGKAASEVDRQHHDAVIGYSRAVISESAEQRGYEYYQYIGPDDSANRPFCDRHVDKVYTREEIDALDNGQIANAMLTGGGYRCRHHWRPVRPEWFDKEERPKASVGIMDIDVTTQWDREHPLDADALMQLSFEDRQTAINEWVFELALVFSGERATPSTLDMFELIRDQDVNIYLHLTNESFVNAVGDSWDDDVDDLTGIQDEADVHIRVVGNSGLLSIATHEIAHVLDWYEDIEADEPRFESGVSRADRIREYERLAWLAEEEFRLSLGERPLWPDETGYGIDEDAMMEWIRENYP